MRRRLFTALGLVLAAAWAPAACRSAEVPSLRGQRPSCLSADRAISLDSESRPAASAFAAIPCPERTRIVLFEGHGAGAETAVSLEPVETQSSESAASRIEIRCQGHPFRRCVFQDRDGFGRSLL
jgi:hypothetical protein